MAIDFIKANKISILDEPLPTTEKELFQFKICPNKEMLYKIAYSTANTKVEISIAKVYFYGIIYIFSKFHLLLWIQ